MVKQIPYSYERHDGGDFMKDQERRDVGNGGVYKLFCPRMKKSGNFVENLGPRRRSDRSIRR